MTTYSGLLQQARVTSVQAKLGAQPDLTDVYLKRLAINDEVFHYFVERFITSVPHSDYEKMQIAHSLNPDFEAYGMKSRFIFHSSTGKIFTQEEMDTMYEADIQRYRDEHPEERLELSISSVRTDAKSADFLIRILTDASFLISDSDIPEINYEMYRLNSEIRGIMLQNLRDTPVGLRYRQWVRILL